MPQTALSIKVARMFRFNNDGALKAFCDISINDAILIRGVKVLDGQRGMFVSMPSEKSKDNKWYESVKCMDQDTRNEVSRCVLEAYLSEGAN